MDRGKQPVAKTATPLKAQSVLVMLRQMACDMRSQMNDLSTSCAEEIAEAATFSQAVVREIASAYRDRERALVRRMAKEYECFCNSVQTKAHLSAVPHIEQLSHLSRRVDDVLTRVDRIPAAFEKQLAGMYPAEPLFLLDVESNVQGVVDAATSTSIRVHNKGRALLRVEVINNDGSKANPRTPRQPWLTVIDQGPFEIEVGQHQEIALSLKVRVQPAGRQTSGSVFLKTNDPLQPFITVPIVYTVLAKPKPKPTGKVPISRQWSRKIGGGDWGPNTDAMSNKELKVALEVRGVLGKGDPDSSSRSEMIQMLQVAMADEVAAWNQ
jgi:hypothetical protein